MNEKTNSFLTSMPSILTGIAAVITAVGGVLYGVSDTPAVKRRKPSN